MARKQRQKSLSGVYHVTLRGVNKQRIFEWEEDYAAMIRIIKSVQTQDTNGEEVDKPNFYLFSYCLMDNHVHLLMQPNGFELWEIVKRLTVAYAMHFNNHYKRVGHLFQDRFKSVPVEERSYFFELLRYIHNNPVKAGVCKTPDLYPYSSFCELTGKEHKFELCNFTQEGEEGVHRSLISSDPMRGAVTPTATEDQTPMCKSVSTIALGLTPNEIKDFLETMPQQTAVEKITQEGLTLVCKMLHLHLQQETTESSDDEIVKTLLELSGAKSITDFQRLDKKTMRGSLAIVREAGCSIRRLSRLSGISEGIIRGCKNPLLLLDDKNEQAKE